MKYQDIVAFAKDKYPQTEAVVSIYTMQILWTNEKLAKVSGYSQQELIDKDIREVVMVDARTLTALIAGRDAETQIILTKSGKKIKGTTTIRTFMYNGEAYFVTFNSSFKPLE